MGEQEKHETKPQTKPTTTNKQKKTQNKSVPKGSSPHWFSSPKIKGREKVKVAVKR